MFGRLITLATLCAIAFAAQIHINEDRSVQASASANANFKATTSFWYANMDHKGSARGYAPYGLNNPSAYDVFRSVDPSAGGQGIQNAITDAGNSKQRHNQWLASQPRVVYLPPGTYMVSSTIRMNTDTVIMGDATNPPIIKAASGFNGDTLFSGQDPGTGESGELSFAVAVKNVIFDTTAINGGQAFTALYWGVAQAAHLQNVKITMASPSNGNGHTGIKLGRGSTLGLSNTRVEKGQNGIWHAGHQQAQYKSIYFYQNAVGLLISGGNTISVMRPTFDGCGTSVKITGGVPYVAVVDATSINSGVTVKSTVYASFLIENLSKDNNGDIAVTPQGTVLGSASHVDTFTYGNTVGRNPIYGATTTSKPRNSILAPSGKYPTINAPTYASNPVTDFINIKDPKQNGGVQVYGDNSRDESDALNRVLRYAAQQNKIAYFPFGVYQVQSTLLIPNNSRIVGEAWSTITGNGKAFKDRKNPIAVVQVGNPGQVGLAQIQDMRFTVSDVLPGAIIFQVQMAGSKPGQVGLWNSLVTVGGTRGADALTNSCGDAKNECPAAAYGIHLTSTSSAYIENIWNWVADHITEGFGGGSNIAGKGGILVEATKGTWLHSIGSEHWWLYQLNLHNAQNVLVSFLQSETNYDQGDNTQQIAPAPWTANSTGNGDPDFSWCKGGDKSCRMGYASYINGGSNIYIYAAASWAFFSGPGYQTCANDNCQDVMHWVQATPQNFNAFGMCSKSAHAPLRLADGTQIVASQGFSGSWGGSVVRYTP